MKILILLIALGVTDQKAEQRPATGKGFHTQGSAPQSLESRLLERAKLIYGSHVKGITFTSGKDLTAIGTPRPDIHQTSKFNKLPFDDPTDVEETKAMSQKGDVASGVILLEEKDILYLDIAPCRPQPKVFTFHVPFNKKRVASLSCNGRNLDKYLVSQR